MENNKKDRTVLKSYFKTNAVPTELNFRDFIDAGLNQKDDGIAKIPDGPIAVQSASTNEDLIHFYRSFEDKDAVWTLGLKGDGKSGLSISEGATTNRLFIEPATGNTGVGTTSPAGKLDVNANDPKGLLVRSGNSSGVYDKSQLTFGYNGTAQYRHAIKTRHHGGEQTNNAMDFYLWNYASNNNADDMPNKKVLTLNGNGSVGINLPNDQPVASAKLQIIADDNNAPDRNGVYLFNNKTGENQHAILAARTTGLQGGNPYLSLDVGGVGGWAIGIDNKASQALKFGSDWNTLTDHTRMTMLRTGNIGIGVDQPTAKLHVNTNDDPNPDKNGLLVSNAKNSANQHAIIGARVAGADAGNPMVSFDVLGKSNWLIGLDSKTSSLKFSSTWNDLNVNTRMTILDDGKVGIGTSPSAKLQIDATGENTPEKNGLMVSNASPNNHAILAARVAGAGTGNPMISLDIVGKANWLIGLDNKNNALKFSSTWSELGTNTRMTILQDGKVGIGLDNPEAPLHVSPGPGQTPPDNGLYVYNKKNEAGQNAIVAARVGGGLAGNPYFSLDVAGVSGWSVGMDNKAGQAFKICSTWDYNLNEAKMIMLRNGNVGIGNNLSPESKLHISGKIRIVDGTEGNNKILASNSVGEGSWIEPFMRRDFRPYRKITYIWDGFNTVADDGSLPMTRVETRGGAGAGQYNNNTFYSGKPLLYFNQLTRDDANTAVIPAKGVYIKMPVTQGVHHSLIISTLEADRWSEYTVWLVDWDGSSRPTRLGRATGNQNNPDSRDFAGSYMLNPRNGMKEFGWHTWLSFAVSSAQIDSYIRDGQLKFLITAGPNNQEGGLLYASGFAMVENPYGFTQQSAVTVLWGNNGEGGTGLDFIVWENEHQAKLGPRKTGTVYVRVVDKEKDLLVTFLEHNSNWFGGSLRITVGSDTTAFGTSPAFSGISHMLYYGRQHCSPQSILIPKEIVKAQLTTVRGVQENMLKLNLENRGGQWYHFRGIDTEAFSQRFMG